MKKLLSITLTFYLVLSALSGAAIASGEASGSATGATAVTLTEYGPVDMAKWQYNETNNVYWQVGIAY